jgi:Uma2 family endonuclease
MYEMAEQLIDLETFRALDTEADFELDEGRLVPLTQGKRRHGKACVRLARMIGDFVELHALGETYGNDTGCVLSEHPATVRGPDVAFLRADRLSQSSEEDWVLGAPDLAVEVLSPSNRPGAMLRKVSQYLDAGARLVWVVHTTERKVVVYSADGSVRIVTDTLDGEDVLPGLRIDLAWLFR